MSKLHELLAVETALENQANATRTQLRETFEKKRHLFEEKRVTFTPNTENAQPVTEAQSDIQSTVRKELEWLSTFITKSFDASYRVAEANTRAKADIETEEGILLARDVPATALLELEKRITGIIELLKSIPTLDPAKGFKLDADRGGGIFVAREVVKTRTQKQKKVIVKYDATPQHPAQTELIDQDVPVGTLRELEWSALLTPAAKADLIDRAEIVGRAVRRARSRANEIEVNNSISFAAPILDYILGK